MASKRLVIDASVARAAGGEGAISPLPKYCRDFLKATLKICHHAVMSKEIENEWNEHQSNYARRWRRYMAGKKKICRYGNTFNKELRRKLRDSRARKESKEAMLKDIHLIEAALLTDKVIVSLDEDARRNFDASTAILGDLKNVVWINPGGISEEPITWLELGAKNEKHRRLGYKKQ